MKFFNSSEKNFKELTYYIDTIFKSNLKKGETRIDTLSDITLKVDVINRRSYVLSHIFFKYIIDNKIIKDQENILNDSNFLIVKSFEEKLDSKDNLENENHKTF